MQRLFSLRRYFASNPLSTKSRWASKYAFRSSGWRSSNIIIQTSTSAIGAMMTSRQSVTAERADFAAVHAALDRLLEQIHAGEVDFLVIAVGQRRETRRFGDQHAHHFAPAPVFHDIFVNEAELRPQQIRGRAFMALEHGVDGVERRPS